MYLWGQVKKIPFDVRMTNPFQLGNVCEDPERCDALEEKGGDASVTICPQCPVYIDCQQRGYLSQPASLNRAKTQILALPELFFNPQYTETADEILKQMDDTERLCILDRIQAYKLFPECKLTKQVLQEWSINWQGSALGDFAKALLHAVEIKDIPHADAVKRIRAVIRSFEWQHKKLLRQVSEVIVWGKVVPRGYVDPDTGTQLARFTIKFEGGASAYIPQDNNATRILTEKGINVFKTGSSVINEDIKIRMSIKKAIQLGVFNIGTVEDIQKLQTINSNPNWTFWHQLNSFFTHYTRDADAPIRWNGKTLRFWVPPVLHPTVKRLMLMSVTLSDKHLQRAFPNKNVEVHHTEPTAWLPGNKVFQIRTGNYPRDTILDYNSNWDLIGLSETAQRFFHGICNEIDRDPSTKHTILTYKAIAARLSDLEKKENVCRVTHFDLLRGMNSILEESHVVWVIGTPSLSEKVIWRRSQILFGNDKEPLSYEKDTESEQYIDERVQSVYQQSAIPKLSRIVHLTKLNKYPNKKVVLISSMVLPQITDRPETLFFDWEDFEVADGLENLPDVIATREQFETERSNLTGESEREHVEHILGCSSRQANRILQKLRGGRPLRIPFKEQIITLLANGDKRTAEFIEAIEGHPKAIKNELGRLVDTGEIVKVRWGVYTLPQ